MDNNIKQLFLKYTQEVREKQNMVRREMEDTKIIQMELLEMKTIMIEIKIHWMGKNMLDTAEQTTLKPEQQKLLRKKHREKKRLN